MFHIAIENNKSINFFNENLIDCIISKTIPIYYGCPNIDNYFNINGFIIIDSINDIYKKKIHTYYAKNKYHFIYETLLYACLFGLIALKYYSYDNLSKLQ